MAIITGTPADENLIGTKKNDTFLLATGPGTNPIPGDNNGLDHYDGKGGHNRILGGASYDVLRVLNNLSNLVRIHELDGGDGQPGYNTILATDGNDTLNFSKYAVKAFTIDGGKGNDTITGTKAADHIRGGEGNDTLNGGKGNDTFYLITGGDTNGTDQYNGGAGQDRIVGGWSYDTLHVTNGLTNLVGIEKLDGGDGQPGYNTILATDGDDTLNFSSYVIKAFTIDGGKGNDTITGTSGDDHIRGGEGNDTLNGGAGNDTFYLITGGNTNGVDQYNGGTGTDKIVGGWSYDTLNVKNGLTNLVGIEEISDSDGQFGYNTILATADHDTLDFSGMSVKYFVIDGQGGNDTITGTADDNQIRGGAGNDTMDGAGGSDTYLVGAGHGADAFLDSGASGTDRIVATAANVSIGISALSGIERISSGGFANVNVVGTPDHQTLDFSSVAFDGIGVVDALGGNDVISTSNLTAQAYRGGAGNDTFVLGSKDTTLRVSAADNGGFDVFSGNTPGADHRIVAETAGTQIGIGLNYSNDVDTIDAGGNANVSIVGSSASHNVWDLTDTELLGITEVATAGGNDQIHTSDHSDAAGGQAYRGGVGNDSFFFGTQDTRLLYSSADNGGFDSFSGNGAATHRIIAEDAGTQIGIAGSYGGTNSVDVIDGNGKANVTIVGSNSVHNAWDFSGTTLIDIASISGGDNTANDTITGSSADDAIFGLGGNDTLNGGLGNDTLTGGPGNDVFVFTSAGTADADTVADYGLSDRVVVSALVDFPASGGVAGDYARLATVGDDTTVEINADGTGGDWQLVATLADYTGTVHVQLGTASQVFDLTA
ncbi:MAG: calcium-binding protein [Amaricoccus sp.]